MSNTFRLVDDGIKKIVNGRKWCGRVYKRATDNVWVGTINKGTWEAEGSTPEAAFEAVVAKYFGYNSAATLKANNSKVRAKRKAVKNAARAAVNEYYRTGNFKPVNDYLDRTGASGMAEALNAFTNEMIKKF